MIKAGGAITIHLEGDRKNRPSKKCENQSIMSSSPPPLPLSLSFSLPALWIIFLTSLSAAPSSSHSLLLSLPLFLTSSLLRFVPHSSLIYLFLSPFSSLSFLIALSVFFISLVTIITFFLPYFLLYFLLLVLCSLQYQQCFPRFSFISPLSTKRDFWSCGFTYL